METYTFLSGMFWPLFVVWIIGFIGTTIYASGTRGRWVSVSIRHGAVYAITALMLVKTGVGFPHISSGGTGFNVFSTLVWCYISWECATSDEDSWWNGRGKKIRKGIKRMLDSLGSGQAVPVGGSA